MSTIPRTVPLGGQGEIFREALKVLLAERLHANPRPGSFSLVLISWQQSSAHRSSELSHLNKAII
jgi:hypothetical protein